MRLYEIFEAKNTKPKAIFMAGSPGSGKSYIADQVISGTGAKRLDIDTLVSSIAQLRQVRVQELPHDEKNSLYKEIYTDKYKNRLETFVNSKTNLLIDSTGRNVNRMKEMVDWLTEQGYECGLVFVWVGLETSLERNAKRERKEDPKFVEQTWHDAAKNLRPLHNLFDDDKFFFVKNEQGVDNSATIRKANLFLGS